MKKHLNKQLMNITEQTQNNTPNNVNINDDEFLNSESDIVKLDGDEIIKMMIKNMQNDREYIAKIINRPRGKNIWS